MFLPPKICCLRLEGKADWKISLGLGFSQINEIDIRQARRLTEGSWTLHWIRAVVLVVTSLYHKMDHIGVSLESLSSHHPQPPKWLSFLFTFSNYFASEPVSIKGWVEKKKVITMVKIYLEKRLKTLSKTIRFSYFSYSYKVLNLFFMFVQELVIVRWSVTETQEAKDIKWGHIRMIYSFKTMDSWKVKKKFLCNSWICFIFKNFALASGFPLKIYQNYFFH